MKRTAFVLALCLIALTGCDSPRSTVETLQKEIASYQASPTDQKQIEIEKNLSKLATQVEKLEQKDDPSAASYQEQLDDLQADYKAARMARTIQDAKNALQGFGEAIKDGVQSFQDTFKASTNSNQ